AMLAREDAMKVRRVVEIVLGLSARELDEFHPIAAAMQMMLDPIDPQTFGALYQQPPNSPRSALLVSGVGDSMTPDRSGAALSLAMGLVPLSPIAQPIDGLTPATEVAANGADGKAT